MDLVSKLYENLQWLGAVQPVDILKNTLSEFEELDC